MVLPPLPPPPFSSPPSTTLESPTHAPNLARRTTMALLPVGSRPPAHPPPSNFPQPPHDSMAPQRHPFWLKQPPRPLNYAHPPVLHLSPTPTTPSLNPTPTAPHRCQPPPPLNRRRRQPPPSLNRRRQPPPSLNRRRRQPSTTPTTPSLDRTTTFYLFTCAIPSLSNAYLLSHASHLYYHMLTIFYHM